MNYWITYYLGVAVVPAIVVFPIAFLSMKRTLGLQPLARQWLPFLLAIVAIATIDFLGARTGLIEPSTPGMAILRLGGPIVACFSLIARAGARARPGG